jgi:polyisoprenoid-binding protein YceI
MTSTSTTVSTWAIDPVHTIVAFAVQHMGMSTFRGRFRTVEGTIRIDEGNPVHSFVTATIDAGSIDVVGERLLGALMREDFFNTEKFSTITFQSTHVERHDDTHWTVTGDLTIRGVTRAVSLATAYLGQGTHPFSGRRIAGFHAETDIDRTEFGLTWNAALDTGAQYLGERVHITLDIEAVRQD